MPVSTLLQHAYHGADSAALLPGRMRNRLWCLFCSGVGGKLVWNWSSGDEMISTQLLPPWPFSVLPSPQIVPLWYGASLGGSLCDSHNPTLRLINRRFSRQYRNVLRHNTKKHKNKIGRELNFVHSSHLSHTDSYVHIGFGGGRSYKNLSAGTLASLVKLYMSVLPLLLA